MSMRLKSGRISKIQREIDQVKFKIDDLCENELPSLGPASPDRLNVYKRASYLKEDLLSLSAKLEELSVTNEKVPTQVFEEQKRQETKRVNNLQKKLNTITDQLEPDDVEEDYFKKFDVMEKQKSILKTPDKLIDENMIFKEVKMQHEDAGKDEDDFVTEDDDDDDDDDDEEYEDDEDRDDEEESLEDKDNDDEEDDEDDEEVVHTVEALTNFKAEQDGDLSFKTHDVIQIVDASEDGWWTGIDKHGNRGLVPSTLVKIIERKVKDKPPLEKKRSGKELWEALKDAPSKPSVTDVLQAMKAVPSGFRSPTLGAWYQKDYRASSWIIPKTSQSNLQFKDLFWDSINRKLRSNSVKVCRTFSLVGVKCVPPVGAGMEVLSRQVYISLWDEEKIISNIHLVKAILMEKDQSWTFTPKIGKNIPSLYHGEFIARINNDNRKLGLLFELNYTYKRTSTGEVSDICCGWTSVPLFDANGNPVGNKNFEVKLSGGTPFEKGIILDPNLDLNTSQSLMQSLIRTNRQPRLQIRSTGYNKLTKEQYDMLPDTLITCQQYARFIGFYRQHAAMTFCREDDIPSDLRCDEILSTFPRVMNYPDLMDALNLVWNEKTRTNLSRSQRRNVAHLQTLFKESFVESAFSLMQCSHLPSFQWANEPAEMARSSFISTFLQQKNVLGGLLSPDYRFKPLNVNKLAFNVVSKRSALPAPIIRDVERT
ncbi:nephrocystin-1-like isoform X2 [Hydractinia symbiolongicarpus]|uniref:nephrocystin-1-like isoform X2 n=1 Tax=Hydractinia symbiolongicarpus TaxID=13093 RepID=UPI00254EADE3|nr:nephrocystin-1-like isoform X2 [Hydractinia symbiolongicarpus]